MWTSKPWNTHGLKDTSNFHMLKSEELGKVRRRCGTLVIISLFLYTRAPSPCSWWCSCFKSTNWLISLCIWIPHLLPMVHWEQWLIASPEPLDALLWSLPVTSCPHSSVLLVFLPGFLTYDRLSPLSGRVLSLPSSPLPLAAFYLRLFSFNASSTV